MSEKSISRMNSNRSADENVVPDVQTKPNRRKKSLEAESSARGTNSVEQAANSGEKGTKLEKKKVEKLLDFKKLDISELDCIFTDFKTTFYPFVQIGIAFNELKAMPMIIARGSDDAIERAEGINVQGILEREFKSVWDLGKIPGLKKAFSNNVQQVKRAPDMVRDFYSQAKKIILEIYHAFSDEEEQKKIEGELNEGDSTSKEKDKKEGNEAEGANGGSIKLKLRKVSPTRKRTKRSFIRS